MKTISRPFNANHIKLLAALFMLVDHVGLMFFPEVLLFRAIGRLSMPLFAFAISEGCRYTRNKVKHVALLLGVAILCQIVYYVAANSLYMCILVTFSASVVTIYALQAFKSALFRPNAVRERILSGCVLLVVVYLVWKFCNVYDVDYGFWGCMTPVFASLFDFRGIEGTPDALQKADCLPVRIACLTIPLVALSFVYGTLQLFNLLALPVLLLYNGEKGKANLKYFFYVFYPAHLGVLQVLAWCLYGV